MREKAERVMRREKNGQKEDGEEKIGVTRAGTVTRPSSSALP